MRYTIGLREANQQLSRYVRAAEEGHEVIITRRGRPVARLTADLARDRTREPAWQAAYRRMIELMASAPQCPELSWSREEAHER
jgi:prevent-host-death family protein